MLRLVAPLAVVVLAGATGCADRACFTWENATSVCPDPVAARMFFGEDCTDIQTIDSRGSFEDGKFCCYDVTRSTRGLPGTENGNCPRGSGGGTPRSTSGTGGFGGSSVSSHGSVVTSVGPGGGTSASTMPSGAGGSGGSTTGMGGAPPCQELPCGFTQGQPLTGCLACAQMSSCEPQSAACDQDVSCTDFEACISSCSISDEPCLSACANQSPEGASVFSQYIDCEVCLACPNACATNPVATLASCSGAGGAGGASP
ncbi:MAG TPA: hypothetical protein VHB21_08805 [Minicystis sp.]|nr:hypothetical protein [Minicystis sp.]